MTRTRGPELSKEFKDYIYNEWTFKQRNAYQIAEQINGDSELMSKFGKTTPAGVTYHINIIRDEFEKTISETALDTYTAEFIRMRQGFEQDIAAYDNLIKLAKERDDLELELKIRRARHECKLDTFRMLQDAELPLQIKKLKKERDRLIPKQGVLKKLEGDSEQGNTTDNQ